jgi:alpha-N-acetylglucosamine transferase
MTSIFIKSYPKDFKWLNYCLKSICKYITGYSDIVLMLDEGSNTSLFELTELPNKIKIEWVKKEGDGYIFQQYCKLTAHHYTQADKILFIDSDCVFTSPLDLSKLPELPEMLYTPYELVGDAICWKECTEKVIKQSVEFEFMRRNGLIYHRSTLENFESFVGDLQTYVLSQNRFSEFNALGAYAWFNEREKYKWVNTSIDYFGEPIVKQMWSHGEFNSKEIEKLIN